MDYALVAGHNNIITGAAANGFQEHLVARQLKDRVIYFLKQLGETVYDCTDEVGRTKEQVWLNAAKNCNNAIGKNGLIIAIHLNAGGGTGTEVFDYKGTQKSKCQAVAQRLAKDFAWPTRGDKGWKDGSWIGLIKETLAPVIYIEVCFIDNITDITKLTRNIVTAAIGIVEEITGKKIKNEEKTSSYVSTPNATDKKLYRLTTGTFKDAQTFADALHKVRQAFPWTIYEKADSTDFNPKYRIVTGTFVGKVSAEQAAQQLRDKFGWTVYVKEE